jgi:hypothetical protein
MTEGHRYREVPVSRDSLLARVFTRPVWHTRNLPRVDASPYPYGPCPGVIGCWYLSPLSILHRWTGLTLRYPDLPPPPEEP